MQLLEHEIALKLWLVHEVPQLRLGPPMLLVDVS